MRFVLFEATALPGILSQTDQDFDWVLVVDPNLPDSYRARLSRLIQNRPRTFVINFDVELPLGNIRWLNQFWEGSAPDFVLTTNVDDDDTLPENFFRALKDNVRLAYRLGELPSFKILATKNYVQWDMLFSREAPLGWKAAWHRASKGLGWDFGVWPTNVGFSLCCRFPAYDVSVLGIDHAVAEFAVDQATNDLGFRTPLLKSFRRRFSDLAIASQESTESWSRDTHFFDLGTETNTVVIGNHRINDSRRLEEVKPEREIVTGPDSFPGIPIDWNIIRENQSLFRGD